MQSKLKRIMIGIVGGFVLLIGLVTIPYPGPGWLTVFAGLAILASEFDWAQRLLDSARARYDKWQAWLKSQKMSVRLLVASVTAIIVVLTVYLLNGYGLINSWLNLGLDWLRSPLPFFAN